MSDAIPPLPPPDAPLEDVERKRVQLIHDLLSEVGKCDGYIDVVCVECHNWWLVPYHQGLTSSCMPRRCCFCGSQLFLTSGSTFTEETRP